MVIIEKLESLKTWLVKRLTPLCDADPNALAKYVLALIKKDKTEEELRKLCVDQLEVFLQSETGTFVTDLFVILSNKGYIEDQSENVTKSPELQNNDTKEPRKGTKRRLQRPSPPIRHRSRSPYDRRRRFGKRSRSPRERRGRRYRSHSGSPKKSRLSPKRRSPNRRSRTRSRSPYRRRRTRSLSSSRSSRSRSPDSSRQKPTSSDDRASKKKRCWDYDQKGFCILGDNCPYDHGSNPVVVEDSSISSTNCPTAPKITPITAPPPLIAPPVRVPIIPPPIMPPFLPPPHVGFPVPPPGLRPPIPPPMPPPPPGTIGIPPPSLPPPPPPRSQPPPGYNPEAPGLGFPQRRHVINTMVPMPSGAPPLIPGIGPPLNRIVQIGPGPVVSPIETSPVKRTIYNNAPPGVQNSGVANNFSANAKIIIRKIPPILNNITKLNEHFSKFGAINNIQVRFENDPQTALVEYAHVNSARSAKRDTGAVMNNRFIMLHWYNPQVSNGRPQQPPQTRTSVKDRLGTIPTPSQLKYTAPVREIVKPEITPDTVIIAGPLTRTISNPNAPIPLPVQDSIPKQEIDATKNKVKLAQQAAKEKLMARQKIVLQKKRELQKQKEQLLRDQMQQQKVFLNKIKSTKDMPANDKLQLLSSLKALTASIDTLRTSIKGELLRNPVEAKAKQKKTEKELLDAELDLYNASTTGENTINLKQKLSQLKVEAKSLGLVTAYRGGWNAPRGRGRGATFTHRAFSASANLDRRPRELRVTGFHDDEKDEVVSHLARFGEIENFTFVDDGITCTVKFQTRAQAELASLHGPTFKNRRLIIVWNSVMTPVVPTVAVIVDPTPEIPGEVPEEEEQEPLIVPEVEEKETANEEEEEDEGDNVNVHIGDVTVNYPSELEETGDDLEDGFEDELDEDALLAADFDEDEQIGDFEEDDEIRSWRH